MRKVFLLIVALFALMVPAMSLAQMDFGVQSEVDQFTGEASCVHEVANSSADASLTLGVFEHGLELGITQRVVDWDYDSAFLYGGGNEVWLLFPGAERGEPLIPYSVDFTQGYSYGLEMAFLHVSRSLVEQLLSSPGPVQVRFYGGDGTVDFTIDHDVILALAEGFGRSCLNSSQANL